MNKNLRAMIEGALTAAIYIMLLLLLLYTPLSIFSFVLIPTPFTIYAARNPWRYSILVGLLSLMVMIPFGLIWALPFLLYGCLVGFVLGYSFSKKHPAIQTGIFGFLATLVFFLLSLLFSALIFNVNLVDENVKMSEEMFRQSEMILGDSVQNALPPDFIEMFAAQMKDRFTALIIIYSFILAFLNYLIGYGLLKRLGYPVSSSPPLSELGFPKSVLFYYLAAIILSFIPTFIETAWIRITLYNILSVLEMVLLIQGVLFLFFIAKYKKVGKWLPILAVVLLFIPIFQYILRLLGIFDLGLNLRQKLSSRS